MQLNFKSDALWCRYLDLKYDFTIFCIDYTNKNHSFAAQVGWGTSVVSNLLNTEIEIVDLLGGRSSFTVREYTRVLGHKRTLLFVALSLISFFAADPSGARNYVPMWVSVLLWPNAFIVYLILYHAGLLALAAASRKFQWLRLPTALLGLICLIPTVFLCEALVNLVSDNTYPYNVEEQMIFYFLSVQSLETVFFRFIMPGVRQELTSEQASELASRQLIVGGEQVDLDKLLHIEAREHHVHLTFEERTARARARLSDIVAQTDMSDGVQPHRSWWVARDPAIRVERKNGRVFLRLRDNTEVPVARTRVDDVLDWLQSHGFPAE